MKRDFYRIIDHTADIGFEVRADDKSALFSKAAYALTDLIVDLESIAAIEERRVSVFDTFDLGSLFITWLSEILFHFETKRFLLSEVKNISFVDNAVHAVLAGEEYGLEILKVREIISVMEITEVPQVPPFIKGVINLRGKVIPVMDLRLKFGMTPVEYTRETCIIVVNIGDLLIGVVVDTVAEVLDINESEIEPPPTFGISVQTDFIMGMGKIKGRVKILLDIDKILSVEELNMTAKAEAVKD